MVAFFLRLALCPRPFFISCTKTTTNEAALKNRKGMRAHKQHRHTLRADENTVALFLTRHSEMHNYSGRQLDGRVCVNSTENEQKPRTHEIHEAVLDAAYHEAMRRRSPCENQL